jgi:hypothetical protein
MPALGECTRQSRATKIKVAESGRQAVFLNPERSAFRIVRADGCLFVGVTSADYIICGTPGDLIVELKGSDVDHALDQIKSTMTAWRRDPVAARTISGLIVCSRVPRFDSKIQRVKLALARDFQAKLNVCSRNQEHNFESLF